MNSFEHRLYVMAAIKAYQRAHKENPSVGALAKGVRWQGEFHTAAVARVKALVEATPTYITQDAAGGIFLTPAGEEALQDYILYLPYYRYATGAN